jgi:hypothetical protein
MERRHQLSRIVAAAFVAWPALAYGFAPVGKIDGLPSVLKRTTPTSVRGIALPQGDPLTIPLQLSAAEQRLFDDVEDGRLDEHSLVEAALVASGAENTDEIKFYADQFAALQAESRRLCETLPDAITKAEAIHRLLHAQLLRRYDADTTNIAATFNSGVYNCASATLLFVSLAADAGLNVQAFELPGHVRAAITEDANQWEIEITSPKWNEAVRQLDAEIPNRRDVSPIGLIAMVYYNQGIDVFHDRQFAAAIAANRRALLLDDNNREARGNLLASVNNWALALCESRQFDAAEKLLADGLNFDASHQAFTHNAAYARKLRMQARPK